MAKLHYNNQTFSSDDGESVLDCLLRHNIDYPHSCRSGICQACLMKITEGPIDSKWQQDLPDTLKSQGYFLACQAQPSVDLRLMSADASECEQKAEILAITPLTYNVIKVKLSAENLDDWLAGQYLNLVNPQGVCRSYSIANIPQIDGFIELHIKLQKQGAMSQWFAEKANTEGVVSIRGPFGKCYYFNPDNLSFDMLLAGTGTGLAPLIGIIKSALNKGHQGKITLLHGGLQDDDIYYVDEIKSLSSLHQNFAYFPCVLKSEGQYPQANITQQLLPHLSNISNTQVYVCGPSDMTKTLKTKAFLAGIPSAKIYSDAFI